MMKRYDLVYHDWAGYEYLASPRGSECAGRGTPWARIEREDGDWVSAKDALALEAQIAEAREQRHCQCSDEEACRFVRERDEARAQLEEAREFIQECANDDLDRVSPGVQKKAKLLLERMKF